MPLNISPNAYNGGAVVLNGNPHTQFMINLMAKKAAKDEALDEYYQKRNNSITGEGLRNQDVGAFMDKVSKMKQFWAQNKAAIRNPMIDGGRAQMNYENMFNDAASFPQQSKTEELKKKPFMDLLADPDKRERVTDKMMYDVTLHDQPLMIKDEYGNWVQNPNRKSFDITEETFNPKEFTTEQWQKYYENIGKGINPNKNKITTQVDPNDPYSNIVTTTTEYTPDQLKAIGDLAKNDYLSDNSLQYSFDKAHPFKEYKQEHPEQFGTLNAIHKSVYGTDIKDDADLHSAIVLQKKIEPTLTAKKEDNWFARDNMNFQQQKALKNMEYENAKRLAQWKKANGISETGDDGLWIDEHIKDKINNGKPARYYDDRTKQWMDVKEISLDPVFEAGLSVNKQSPDFAYVLPNGEIRYGLYKRKNGADGKPTNEFVTENGKKSVDMTNVRTISQGDLKLSIAKEAGVKQMNKEMSGQPNQSNTQAASDSYSRSELKKAGWTDAQISTAVKAGKIKVHD